MNPLRTFWLTVFSMMFVVSAPLALAQEEDEGTESGAEEVAETVVEAVETGEDAATAPPAEAMEEVIVTGSRLKRTTFESISPLQIVNAEISREAGLVDAAEIIQTSTSSADVQIDLTFSGFVLDNGPGASTANLRGLSSDRTLILLNGRRMAPGGVEGAPSNPDLNLIPGSLVAQYDFLLDGASSVYGSDAIAGVVNVKLRKDFNGFEVRGSTDNTDAFGPSSSDISFTWGRISVEASSVLRRPYVETHSSAMKMRLSHVNVRSTTKSMRMVWFEQTMCTTSIGSVSTQRRAAQAVSRTSSTGYPRELVPSTGPAVEQMAVGLTSQNHTRS